jgi:hypothetical protein
VKKIFAGIMGLAMVLGLAFGGTSASAAGGGFASPQISTELTKLQYVWGTDTYVQMYLSANPSNVAPVDVYVTVERNVNGTWVYQSGKDRMITVNPGQAFYSNFLIASNGVFTAKGNYRFHYETSWFNGTDRELGYNGYGDSSFVIK